MKKTLISLFVGLSSLGALAETPTNLFDGAISYINPDYAKAVDTFLNNNVLYKDKAKALGLLDAAGSWKIPTALWLDSRKAIVGEIGRSSSIDTYLKGALEEANKQGKPVILTFVIYDLPIRDCDAYSSNGEFTEPEQIDEYKTTYIDKIAEIFQNFYSNPENKNKVRLALVIEPDSLPNLITNINNPSPSKCFKASKPYLEGIGYALQKFSSIPNANISMYLDIAHSGWLGWKDNINKFANFYNNSEEVDPATGIPKGLGKGFDAVRGFITNTSNYTPVRESFTYDQYLPNYSDPAKSAWIRPTKFYGWNLVYDEVSYVAEIMSLQKADGQIKLEGDSRILAPAEGSKYEGKYFLIDTSRNGWIPNAVDYKGFESNGTAHTYTRRDQRHHRGNWCNIQSIQPQNNPTYNYDNPSSAVIPSKPTSTGYGELPQAVNNSNRALAINPLYGDNKLTLPIDAFVWIKPPGESDGFYDPTQHAGKQGDQMCANLPVTKPYDSKSGGGSHNDYQLTDSLQGDGGKPAPRAGQFSPAAFKNWIDASGCITGKFTSHFCPGNEILTSNVVKHKSR